MRLIFVVLASLTLAGWADAATPIPLSHMAWIHITDAYTAQAAAHGAKAVCTDYDNTGTKKMSCRFGTRGRVVVNASNRTCVYNTLVFFPGGSAKGRITYCVQNLAGRPLPAPWTYGH